MAADIKVPTLGESVTTATVARWLKKAGDAVAADEPLVELETDKVTVEVNAPTPARSAPWRRRRARKWRSAPCSARSKRVAAQPLQRSSLTPASTVARQAAAA